jgi:hypothetical protein
MRSTRHRFIAAAGLAALAAVPLPRALAANPTAPTAPAPPPPPVSEKDFNVKNFSAASITVTNKFLPLLPGVQYTLTGTATRGTPGEHTVIFTVTNVTKVVDGVNAVALWDRDFQSGKLVEEELAFMAQDDGGNVWSLGEYPEEHADNGTVSAPSVWLAGVQQAIAGLLMQADPQPNTPSYLQGKAPAIAFLDQASVTAVNQPVCIPIGCFDGAVVVDEFNPLNQPQDGHQIKYHIPGFGFAKVVGQGGVEQETLELTDVRSLDAAGMAAATTRTLQLDQNAYKMAKAVFNGSPPAVVRPAVP